MNYGDKYKRELKEAMQAIEKHCQITWERSAEKLMVKDKEYPYGLGEGWR